MLEPQVSKPPKGPSPDNFGGYADFKDRYQKQRIMYGEAIGYCEVGSGGCLTCWTTYGAMELHPEVQDPTWQIMNRNLGDEIREARGIPLDSQPVAPSVVVAYLAGEKQRGIDTLYWYGYPRTNPRQSGGNWEQYFDKAILQWPGGSLNSADDPASVKRLPVGSIMWSIEHLGVDPLQPDPWTSGRLWLTGVGLASLATGSLPLLLPSLFGRRRTWGDF
jgi:hypothetical protein